MVSSRDDGRQRSSVRVMRCRLSNVAGRPEVHPIKRSVAAPVAGVHDLDQELNTIFNRHMCRVAEVHAQETQMHCDEMHHI